ncbi:MAG: hypothetical protein HY040_22510 [Planctomycetes bacterium]|nr:hypothetical protein [Planctomycetota bacterium]
MRKSFLMASGLVLASASVFYFSGCNRGVDESKERKDQSTNLKRQKDQAESPSDKKDADHAHKPGAHGGIIVEIGRDNYHAEAVFENGGLLKLYTLGKDESRIIDVESQVLKAYVKVDSGNDSVEMELSPVPRTGDKPGRTSQFIGKLPGELAGKQVAVTIPIIVVEGERFRLGFTSAPAKHDEGMPIGANPADENDLYLKPGGIYTEADIKANGNVTASEKFKGVLSKHDMRPKAGDKICPITMTKATPKFTWVVGGKTYEFCCPPCVDEFVTWAKTQPDLIKEPEIYVKKK